MSIKKSLIKKIEKIFPSPSRFQKEEYKNRVFLIDLPEAGTMKNMKIRGFSGFARTGDITSKQPIRFYAKVVGFEDINAPKRNWGLHFTKFLRSFG